MAYLEHKASLQNTKQRILVMRNIIQGVCVFLFSFLVGVDDDSFNKSDRREFVDKPKRVLFILG
jgi:hypothetical protein